MLKDLLLYMAVESRGLSYAVICDYCVSTVRVLDNRESMACFVAAARENDVPRQLCVTPRGCLP